MSRRKPHNHHAGCICELRNPWSGGHTIIYHAAEQGIDSTGGRYAVVCNTHGAIYNTTSMPKARSAMKAPDFCEQCAQLMHPEE